MTATLLRGGHPWGHGAPADILVGDGLIQQVGAALDAPAAHVVDVTGQLVLPGLVESRRSAPTWRA
ncbi:hypothetical protein AB0K48_59570, partial [Nonomuraea sp. NPDC055795]